MVRLEQENFKADRKEYFYRKTATQKMLKQSRDCEIVWYYWYSAVNPALLFQSNLLQHTCEILSLAYSVDPHFAIILL